MAKSGENYLEIRKRQIERKRRILTTVSIVSFVGSLVFGAISTLNRSIHTPPIATTTSDEYVFQEQAKGYELVLQREPNNQVALEKLSIIHLRLQDYKRAIALMEKLVQQHPNRQDYKTVLHDMKKKEKRGKFAGDR